MLIAVETGDIVRSTRLSSADFTEAISVLNAELADHQHSAGAHYEMFRGDAFQVYYPNPQSAIKACLLSKLRLMHCLPGKPIALTQAIAFGHQDSVDELFSKSMGQVFIASGRLLDSTAKAQLGIAAPNQQAAIRLIQEFINQHLAGLTQKQSEIVYYYLKENYPEQQFIADKLKMSRQNVAAHLKRGGADLLRHSITFFEQYCEGNTL
jgi:predicted DNA-binding protein YlxM (UPF0122 family)